MNRQLVGRPFPWCCRWQGEQLEWARAIQFSGTVLRSTVSNFLDYFKRDAGGRLLAARAEVQVKVRLQPGTMHLSVRPWFGMAGLSLWTRSVGADLSVRVHACTHGCSALSWLSRSWWRVCTAS
jgi:hypothetical protein